MASLDPTRTIRLSAEQQQAVLLATAARLAQFPFADFRRKLAAADEAYHMAAVRSEEDPCKPAGYNRFAEIDNSVVREVADTYASYYINNYISKDKLFVMTSSADGMDTAQAFNTILQDQDRQCQHKANLSKFFLDCAKYNIGLLEVDWVQRELYNPALVPTQLAAQVERKAHTWEGNSIRWCDLYNSFFDTRVSPHELHERGEFAGSTQQYSQVELFKLVQQLKASGVVAVYDTAADDPSFSIYNITSVAGGQATARYYQPEVQPLGATSLISTTTEYDWSTHLEQTPDAKRIPINKASAGNYEVTTITMRLVPSCFGLPAATSPEEVELWRFWILDGTHLLASSRLNFAHNYLPYVLGQPDSDSLGINASGPAQVAIPYKKLAKQLMDRVLAGADRAIRGKSIFDPTYVDSDALNSTIPDINIPLKSPLMGTRSIDQVFRNIDFRGDTTGLGELAEDQRIAALRAGGINNSQLGQFTKGNRTLEEYSDVQESAVSRQFIRLLVLESSALSAVKRMLKLNILQYQPSTQLFNPDTREQITIDPTTLFQAEVEFVLADAFIQSDYMVSPNVQQQILMLITQMPHLFQEYNIPKLVLHIIQQSQGVNMEQYKLSAEELAAQQQQLAAAQAAQQGGE